MIVLNNVKLPLEYNERDEANIIAEKLGISCALIGEFKKVKLAVDARNKSQIYFIANYVVSLNINEREFCNKYPQFELLNTVEYVIQCAKQSRDVIVIGSGPAGLFCAMTLARGGLKPIVLERGESVESRVNTVKKFWETGELNSNSNVQFGEGGAGTFSDGKLTTGIKDERKGEILRLFHEFGAHESVEYLAKPHIGTDKLIGIVRNMREEIKRLGGQVLFNHLVTDFIIENGEVKGVIVDNLGEEKRFYCSDVVLAIGHSSRDTYSTLNDKGVEITPKAFSIGVRIEHKQEDINKSQYGKFYKHPSLPPAEYKLAYHLDNGRSVYTFCMCPGGKVVASQSEQGGVVTNGMSEFARDNDLCNSAVLVGVEPSDFGNDDCLAGVRFQEKYEKLAYLIAGANRAPSQLVGDFLSDKKSQSCKNIYPTYKPGVVFSDLRECLPSFVAESLKQGLKIFDNKLKGFANPNAVLTGVETRSSSPVRIVRNSDFLSNIGGLYPCGEGCGYAGGIMSAAVDGMKIGESIIKKYS